MDALYPLKFVSAAGEYSPGSPQFLEWYNHTLELTAGQWTRGLGEAELKIITATRNGETAFAPSAIEFCQWAKHGNKPAGAGARNLIAWNSPEHARFDPKSGEYGGKPHPDSAEAAKLLANPNSGKAISQGERHRRGNDALTEMLSGLDDGMDASTLANYPRSMALVKIKLRKKSDAARREQIQRNREEFAKRGTK